MQIDFYAGRLPHPLIKQLCSYVGYGVREDRCKNYHSAFRIVPITTPNRLTTYHPKPGTL